MRLLAHRGFWTDPKDKNSQAALSRAFEHQFGVETDIRDHLGRLVIAHDKPRGGEMPFGDFLELIPDAVDADLIPLALNIKADGLVDDVRKLMGNRPTSSWFVFDMSVPDMLSYVKAGLPVFTRLSDYESEPVAYEQADGLWIDGFHRDWSDFVRLRKYLDDGKSIALVSPELHGRSKEQFWAALRMSGLCTHSRVMLCTDFPLEAETFFAEAVA
jgi:hypothetical protein